MIIYTYAWLTEIRADKRIWITDNLNKLLQSDWEPVREFVAYDNSSGTLFQNTIVLLKKEFPDNYDCNEQTNIKEIVNE